MLAISTGAIALQEISTLQQHKYSLDLGKVLQIARVMAWNTFSKQDMKSLPLQISRIREILLRNKWRSLQIETEKGALFLSHPR